MAPAYITGGELGGLEDPNASRLRVLDRGVPWADYVSRGITTDPEKMWKAQQSLRKVVGFIARNVSVVPFHLYERKSGTDRARVSPSDHTLARLLAEPSPHHSAVRFRRLLMTDLALYDRYAFTVVDDAAGLRFAVLPARDVSFESNRLREVTAVKVATGHDALKFPASGTVYDYGWNAAKAEGVSPVETLANLLRELAEGAEYRRRLMSNAVASELYIERPKDAQWSDTARERFKDDWREFTTGGAQAGKAPILEDGMKLANVPHNAGAKTQDLEARQLSDAQVASAYFVPPEIVGARPGTFANVDAFRQMLYGPVLGPWLEDLAGAMNTTLLPLFDLDPERYYIEPNVRDRTRGSFLEEAAVNQTAAGGPYMTRNEVRARQNLPAIEGGDELIVPLNVVEGGLASPTDTAPKAQQRVLGTVQRRAPQLAKASEPQPLEDKPARKDLADTIEAHFRAKLADVRAQLEPSKGAKADDEDPLDVTAADIARMYDTDAADLELAAAVEPHLFALAADGAAEVVAEHGRPDEDWDPEVMRAWIAKAAESQAGNMNTTWLEALAAAVVGVSGWRAALGKLADESAVNQAGVWSQTAGTEAASFGGSDAARWSGLTQKTWQVTSAKPRQSHAAISGETVGLSELFSNGARWPGDSALDASEVANCSCVVSYT